MAITKKNWDKELGICQEALKEISAQLEELASDFGEIANRANDAGYAAGRATKEELNDH